MTDLELIKKMLKEAGLEYVFLSCQGEGKDCNYIIIERGYSGMQTHIIFDKYGKLVDIGAYE
jgi:hypothetical protein